jgi:hypothetical protein
MFLRRVRFALEYISGIILERYGQNSVGLTIFECTHNFHFSMAGIFQLVVF